MVMQALFDTCIVIDYLNGISQAKTELSQYSQKFISAITWMEVMVGTTGENSKNTENYLQQFDVIDTNQDINTLAVELRKQGKIKLPDAVIWASAQHNNLILVTRNSKDFDKGHPGIRIPYVL